APRWTETGFPGIAQTKCSGDATIVSSADSSTAYTQQLRCQPQVIDAALKQKGTVLLFYRQRGAIPRPPAAIERNCVLVPHLAQIVRGQRRPVSTAAVEHHHGVFFRRLRLDVPL